MTQRPDEPSPPEPPAGHAPGSEAADAPGFDHVPVLRAEVLELLDPQPGEVYADATAGFGGHASLIATRLGPTGTVILNDLDPAALEIAEQRVRAACAAAGVGPPTIRIRRGGFDSLLEWLAGEGLPANLFLADLGFNSAQVDDPARGLSFRHEGPLDMRLDPSGDLTASDLVASLPENELADLIYKYGEERLSRRIARRIVEARRDRPILTTTELAEIVRAACPSGPPRRGPNRGKGGRGGSKRRPGPSRIDPATRTFQALRIAVNDEIGRLESLLSSLGRARSDPPALSRGARVGIIAFHSLEDRPVKQAFLALAQEGLAERITRKCVRATPEETESNPRARSARLRVVRML
ncbi:MAG: 16S rRNA (cytosine(1402)-N(4))-methyltransferase [Phycisphaerales bacterium JB037]